MEDSNQIDSLIKEIEKDLSEEYRKNTQIIKCLNQLEEIIDKEIVLLL